VKDGESFIPADEVPQADALDQQRPADFDDETGLDAPYLSTTDREANEADLIDQAFVVSDPDDERGVDQ
jgi:hypothetical protein